MAARTVCIVFAVFVMGGICAEVGSNVNQRPTFTYEQSSGVGLDVGVDVGVDLN